MKYIVITSKHHDGFAIFDCGSVQHRAGDTVQARSFEGACGGVQGTGHPAGVLFVSIPRQSRGLYLCEPLKAA